MGPAGKRAGGLGLCNAVAAPPVGRAGEAGKAPDCIKWDKCAGSLLRSVVSVGL